MEHWLNIMDIKLNIIVKEDPEKDNLNEKEESEVSEKPSKQTKTADLNDTEKSAKTSIKKHPLLQEEFTFDTFIPGDNSRFAYNAAIAVANEPGKKYNPILFYGGSGLGKTHLMQAIGNYIYHNGGEKLKICYVSAENFGNDFTA